MGLYMLHLLSDTKQDLGLYRDNMLGVTRLRGRSLEKMRQTIQRIFQEAGLKVIGTLGLEATDFLDIFLDLRAGTHRSFVKEGDRPTYVHSQSNHPPNMLNNKGWGLIRGYLCLTPMRTYSIRQSQSIKMHKTGASINILSCIPYNTLVPSSTLVYPIMSAIPNSTLVYPEIP